MLFLQAIDLTNQLYALAWSIFGSILIFRCSNSIHEIGHIAFILHRTVVHHVFKAPS